MKIYGVKPQIQAEIVFSVEHRAGKSQNNAFLFSDEFLNFTSFLTNIWSN